MHLLIEIQLGVLYVHEHSESMVVQLLLGVLEVYWQSALDVSDLFLDSDVLEVIGNF